MLRDLNSQKTVVIGEEIWMQHFDPFTKSTTSVWTWTHKFAASEKKIDRPNMLESS